MDNADIEKIVDEVMKRIPASSGAALPAEILSGPLFDTMDEAISASVKAQKFFQDQGVEKRVKIIEAIRKAALDNAEVLASAAQIETKMGRAADKIIKNKLAAEKTPGVEDVQPGAFTGDHGMTLVEYGPFGVVGSVIPSTNPTSTVINNTISILSGGNSVIFAPHPSAKNCSLKAISILQNAVSSAGGPGALISAMKKPSLEGAEMLFDDPRVKLMAVTGGPAVVRRAMRSEKRVIAAGPGNPPVVIDETAQFPKCAADVISGASFDNGVLCTAEKAVIVCEKAWDSFISAMRADSRAFELNAGQFDALTIAAIKEPATPEKSEGVVNRDFIGRDAAVIAKAIGIEVPSTVRLLWAAVPQAHPFVWTEQLMPVLPVTMAADIDEAIELARKVEAGNRHTAVMHSTNVANLSKMARAMQCSIFVKNGPSYMGLGMGTGYATLTISTPTGEGLTKAKDFTRELRCALVDNFRIV
ncbi:MAG: aldehyde dehydrogenase EutE [Elusimicrobia bacterium HGW-Elusimicrobia-2]|nr:MAG: aldehyde dehydrogenase EutE [Elusimicrobia bacterium HGW-Elusimicrobia-2]